MSDLLPTKTNDNNYITVNEGIYNGVSYRINNTEFEDSDGKHFLKFDYDVKGLEEGKEKDFENYLGEFLINALTWAIEEDKKNPKEIGV